jgi:pimeloyl-ACP methyl ester carboxylesterase
MKVYLIPGLGADKRMYTQQLKVLPDAVVLEHLPVSKNESLDSYVKRVAKLIDVSEPFILVGCSLGGIISIELSKLISPKKIIIISSIKSRDEMPLFMRGLKYVKLHRLIAGKRYKKFNNLLAKRLDGRGDKETARIIIDMAMDTPSEFIEWGLDTVIHWMPPQQIDTEIIHIHGDNDQLFPIKLIRNAIVIKNGSHVMNMSNSAEVNAALLKALNKNPIFR